MGTVSWCSNCNSKIAVEGGGGLCEMCHHLRGEGAKQGRTLTVSVVVTLGCFILILIKCVGAL